MERTKYAVISKVQSGWATVYVGPSRDIAEQIAARERRNGRDAHVLATIPGAAS
jgi:hypothetical protein